MILLRRKMKDVLCVRERSQHKWEKLLLQMNDHSNSGAVREKAVMVIVAVDVATKFVKLWPQS